MWRSRSALGARAVCVGDCAANVLLVVVPCGGNNARKRGVRGLELGLARREIGRDAGAEPCHCWGIFARLAHRGIWRGGRAARLVGM